MKAGAMIRTLLTNSSVVFLGGIVAGLTLSAGASHTEVAVTPVLGVVMTASLLDISSEALRNLKQAARGTLFGLILTYLVLGGIVLALAYTIVEEGDLRTGLVIAAAVPPAVAVIPLTYHLGGNTGLTLVAEVGCYVAALAFTPLILFVLLGGGFVDPAELLIVLAELIVAPLAVSRILRKIPALTRAGGARIIVIIWGLFLVNYTMIGLNRDEILGQPGELIAVIIVAFACTFVLGEVLDRSLGWLGVSKADRIGLILMGTRKNYGLAGAIALAFFHSRAAIPAALMGGVAVLHFVWLIRRVRRMN